MNLTERIIQVICLPVSVPVWLAVVAIQRNMEPVNLEDFQLI